MDIFIFIIITLIILLIYTYTRFEELEPDKLLTILQPGKYLGTATYISTEIYPEGLNSTNELTITKLNGGVVCENFITMYSSGTKIFTAKRTEKFFYQPNHGNRVFRQSTSIIDGDDRVVSSSHGYLSYVNNTRITFALTGSWHISKKYYKKMNMIITKTDKGFEVDYGIFKESFVIQS